MPARYRGWTDLVINGSFWIGAAIGAVAAIVLLDPAVAGPELGWRLAYFIGAALGLIVFLMRFWIPESPRWLMIHGQPDAGPGDRRRDRAFGASDSRRQQQAFADDPPEDARPHAAWRSGAHACSRLSPAHAGRIDADDGAGVLLQRDLLHLCADPDRLLRHPGQPCRLVPPAVRGRQFPRARCCSAACSTRSAGAR